MNIFVFDIETVPDVDSGRRLFGLEDLPDKDVGEIMFSKRREETAGASDFLRLHMHRVVAVSAVLQTADGIRVWSLGDSGSPESDLVQRFFDGIEKFRPQLVSWNGSGFDLPVLHYRALLHGIASPAYWETGDNDREFKWNNYLSRYHARHTDLMDVIAAYQPRANAPLDQIASMLGFPGKMGMSGASVWDYWLDGRLEDIRNYCETDVLNTYLVWLRFELIRGNLTGAEYALRCKVLRDTIAAADRPHFEEFLAAWGD